MSMTFSEIHQLFEKNFRKGIDKAEKTWYNIMASQIHRLVLMEKYSSGEEAPLLRV